jgi:hypothetical protein
MNLMCPNCQKMLTVPEEFAGQLMKCPLCTGTFTVPGLPSAAPPSPPPPEPDTYSIHPDDATLPPPPPEEPALPMHEPLPPLHSATTAPSPPPSPTSLPSLSPLPTDGYRRTATLSINPRVLPWVAPVCLVLVFFLLFFNWLGLYPGGVPAATQNAWQAGFAGLSIDGDMADLVPAMKDEKYKPGASVLTIFYLLLFIPVLLVTIASIAIDFVSLKLPPAVERLLPWRWGIVAAANLILFLFLALQLLLGFSLDNRYGEWVDGQFDTKAVKKTDEQKKDAARRGEFMDVLYHTWALKLAILLHLLAIVCSALMFWASQRGTTRPLPRMELRW